MCVLFKKNVTGARVSAPRVSANTRWRARTSRCWTSKPRSGSAARAPSPTPPSPPGRRAPRFSSAASTSTARDRTRTRATQSAWRLKPVLVPASLNARANTGADGGVFSKKDDAPSADGASFPALQSSLRSSRDARRARGASLLARAATAGVREAHHTLAVMHFNGSGGRRRDKDPGGRGALRALNLLFDCVSAKRELGHCLQDGFGVERDAALGAKLLDEAAAADAKSGKGLDAAVLAAPAAAAIVEERLRKRNDINTLNAAVAAAAEGWRRRRRTPRRRTSRPHARTVFCWTGTATAPRVTPLRNPKVPSRRCRRGPPRARTPCAGARRLAGTSSGGARAAGACGTAAARARARTGGCSTSSRVSRCSSCTAGRSPTPSPSKARNKARLIFRKRPSWRSRASETE